MNKDRRVQVFTARHPRRRPGRSEGRPGTPGEHICLSLGRGTTSPRPESENSVSAVRFSFVFLVQIQFCFSGLQEVDVGLCVLFVVSSLCL